MNTEKNTKEKLDIIVNIPGFYDFVIDALDNAKLKLSDYNILGDLEPTKEEEIYLIKISK